MRSLSFRQAPRRLHKAQLDNVVLVPASLLPYKKEYQAIANGLISPVLLVLLMLISRDRAVLGDFTTSRLTSLLGWATTLAMAAAAISLLGTLGWS